MKLWEAMTNSIEVYRMLAIQTVGQSVPSQLCILEMEQQREDCTKEIQHITKVDKDSKTSFMNVMIWRSTMVTIFITQL